MFCRLAEIIRDKENIILPKFPVGIDPDCLEKALDSIGAFERTAVRAKSPQVRLKQLQHAFDAGRTLKLIHALRERALPSLTLRRAIEEAVFVEISTHDELANAIPASKTASLETIALALGRPV